MPEREMNGVRTTRDGGDVRKPAGLGEEEEGGGRGRQCHLGQRVEAPSAICLRISQRYLGFGFSEEPDYEQHLWRSTWRVAAAAAASLPCEGERAEEGGGGRIIIKYPLRRRSHKSGHFFPNGTPNLESDLYNNSASFIADARFRKHW